MCEVNITDIYRVLSDPTRRTILHMLAQGDRTQSDFVQFFDISQPAVKKHLQILLEEGVISEQKQGKYRIYRLEQALLQSAYQSLLQDMGYILGDRLTRLKTFLEGEEN
ncbi:DNA-binding transcriptional regulator, ArsR family [Paenibacillus sp. cl6col]|uniref:ArsR/SmtB family transcription factor n=1 Tax=Paenibacillus alvei TaxID=44250 RepID=UPI00055DE4DC|nr:metalloregulator ArsR/SmtB family transcription factor [Paenibacillus alvei]SDG09572.1 DNA-binding transcriptional regulator, ArsR family [Paenibacillus sp. cl6col]